MARTTSTASARRKSARSKAAKRAATVDASAGSLTLEFLGVALFLGSVLLLGALFTFAPEGARGGMVNVTGPAGRAVASALLGSLGAGAWLFPLFILGWSLQCLRGVRPKSWSRKVMLLPLLMALTAITAALLFRNIPLPGVERYGPGGFFGLAIGTALFGAFGKGAGLLVFTAASMIALWMTDIRFEDAVARAMTWFGIDPRAKPKKKRKKKTGDEEWDEDEGDWEYEDDDEAWEDEEGYDDEEEWEDEEDNSPDPQAVAPAPRPTPRKIRPKPAKKRPKQRGAYVPPPLDLLQPGELTDPESVKDEVAMNAEKLEAALASFRIEAKVESSLRGPVITFYEIRVPSGVKLGKIRALSEDLAVALKARSVRMVAPIPGKDTIGIEVPNMERDSVALRDLLEEVGARTDHKQVPILLGRDTAGRPIIEDLTRMPHCLIAGATGSGKSVCINSVLLSILYTRGPDEVNLILVDPKQVELSCYEGVPHLLTHVVTESRRAAKILDWAVDRMEERYSSLLACKVRNINGYNKLPKAKKAAVRERLDVDEEALPDKMPFIVIVVDELADLILTGGKEVELAITRLAQKSRAVGIHMILATQRPSTNVITGLIKANMPTRIAFTVSSKIDSRVVLDQNGAENLLGMGDLLFMSPRSLSLVRAQGALASDEEVLDTVDHLKEKYPEIEYDDILRVNSEGLGDPMKVDEIYNEAVRLVLTKNQASATMLRSMFGLGHTRATRLIALMEQHGVVGPHRGSKARELLLTLEEWEGMQNSVTAAVNAQGYDYDDPPCVDESWD